ncbi:MAG: ABC transporter substrate-binding protein [Candidatus Dadabacteria bacterium]|nr:MAG: ABC transporter substrate-binding protein [Candidatus Dadabacteria bacterium]
MGEGMFLRTIVFSIGVLSAFPLLSFCDTLSSKPLVKIGISSALTGGAATYGMDLRDAIVFANEKLGKGRYKLIIEDDKCSGREAVTIAQKFIHVEHVDWVMGYACSGAALAALPLYKKAGIPVMITAASSPKIRDAGKNVFRTFPSDQMAARKLYSRMKTQKGVMGILSEETDYCQDFKNAFLDAAKEDGIKVAVEDVLPSSSDYRSVLLRLRKKGVDLLFLNSQSEQGVINMVKQIHEMGWKVKLFAAYWPDSPVFLRSLGNMAYGIEYVVTQRLDDLLTEDGRAVYKEFLDKGYKIRSIGAVFASSFEGFRVVDEVIRNGSDPESYILGKSFNGIFGRYSFDKHGEIKGLGFVVKRLTKAKNMH